MADGRRVRWSELPSELVQKISKCLDSKSDAVRFRAVCNSWRSATEAPKDRPPVRLPLPYFRHPNLPSKFKDVYLNLVERTVYVLQFPESQESSYWVVKIERLPEEGKVRILNPLTHQEIKILPDQALIPNVLNTLNFRIFEVCKAYNLRCINPSNPQQNDFSTFAKKVVFSPSFGTDEYVVVLIDYDGMLQYIKSGDDYWSRVGGEYVNRSFVDLLCHEGQFYGVDSCGNTWVFDSSFVVPKIIKWSGLSYISVKAKYHLLELEKEILMVEKILDKGKRVCKCVKMCGDECPSEYRKDTVVAFKFYTLGKEAEKWVEITNLDNRVVFLGDDCTFSVSAMKLGTRVFYGDQFIYFRTRYNVDDCGYKHNEVFDIKNFDAFSLNAKFDDYGCDNFVPTEDVKLVFSGLHGHSTGVCDFETGKIGSVLRFPELAAGTFWPPPSWIHCS